MTRLVQRIHIRLIDAAIAWLALIDIPRGDCQNLVVALRRLGEKPPEKAEKMALARTLRLRMGIDQVLQSGRARLFGTADEEHLPRQHILQPLR
jgi:hypothetical protein